MRPGERREAKAGALRSNSGDLEREGGVPFRHACMCTGCIGVCAAVVFNKTDQSASRERCRYSAANSVGRTETRVPRSVENAWQINESSSHDPPLECSAHSKIRWESDERGKMCRIVKQSTPLHSQRHSGKTGRAKHAGFVGRTM